MGEAVQSGLKLLWVRDTLGTHCHPSCTCPVDVRQSRQEGKQLASASAHHPQDQAGRVVTNGHMAEDASVIAVIEFSQLVCSHRPANDSVRTGLNRSSLADASPGTARSSSDIICQSGAARQHKVSCDRVISSSMTPKSIQPRTMLSTSYMRGCMVLDVIGELTDLLHSIQDTCANTLHRSPS